MMSNYYDLDATLQATNRCIHLVLEVNQIESHQDSNEAEETLMRASMTLMPCPSVLSAPTLMGYLYAYISILRAPHTMRRVDVVLAAIPNLASSGQ